MIFTSTAFVFMFKLAQKSVCVLLFLYESLFSLLGSELIFVQQEDCTGLAICSDHDLIVGMIMFAGSMAVVCILFAA